jgi:leucyl-tRNA synthetase
MSKSKGNVIDPDEQVALVGADTVKMYLAFMGPYEGSNYPWDLGGIAGLRRFLERVHGLKDHVKENETADVTAALHKLIKKVQSDIVEFKFNTAISAMMMFVNLVEKLGLKKETYFMFLRVLAPFAPHLTEELWRQEFKTSIHKESFPAYEEALTKDSQVTIGVQINGKLRGEVTLAPDAPEALMRDVVLATPEIAKKLEGVACKKIIYVPGRIINILT